MCAEPPSFIVIVTLKEPGMHSLFTVLAAHGTRTWTHGGGPGTPSAAGAVGTLPRTREATA
ncbi:hypothetical protein GCM10017562_18110 [Streptomyces roseofulvus]